MTDPRDPHGLLAACGLATNERPPCTACGASWATCVAVVALPGRCCEACLRSGEGTHRAPTDPPMSTAEAVDEVERWLRRTSRTDPHLSDGALRVLIDHARATSPAPEGGDEPVDLAALADEIERTHRLGGANLTTITRPWVRALRAHRCAPAPEGSCPDCHVDPDEDPLPWCDCRSEDYAPGEVPTHAGPCRFRAHDPADCPRRSWYAPVGDVPYDHTHQVAGDMQHVRVVDLDEADFLAANERLGDALTEVGIVLGLPRPVAHCTWGAAEVLLVARSLRAELDSATARIDRALALMGQQNGETLDRDLYDALIAILRPASPPAIDPAYLKQEN